ncbi:MAG TPA: flagellar basal body L-ring protein FlgH [Terracidiphilus sp.]|jgi:flagellar L-ring protein precursor FlgH|nr:flagellar basal body L-ring protein FlgH [Terracidiphilus sp.]
MTVTGNKGSRLLLAALLSGALAAPNVHAAKTKKPTSPAELRTDYVTRVQEQQVPAANRTVGSLWSPSDLSDLSGDYKARKLNDTVVILVAIQTTAAQSGDVNSSRAFSTTSALTGLAGDLKTTGVNPLFAGNSNTTLKGSGATDSNTTFQTSMTAQVIAVLPSGNLVVEAQRKIFMNNQHEDVTIRGVVRPNDIGPSNTVPSTALSNLEVEMKGKGIIADSTRPPNRITRAILWLLGF